MLAKKNAKKKKNLQCCSVYAAPAMGEIFFKGIKVNIRSDINFSFDSV
jgi:hypothetical protein